jgi:hypothetical protein
VLASLPTLRQHQPSVREAVGRIIVEIFRIHRRVLARKIFNLNATFITASAACPKNLQDNAGQI